MGNKVHPTAFRLIVSRDWSARWYAGKNFAQKLASDCEIRDYIKGSLAGAGISRISVERFTKRLRVTIEAGRAGLIIGKKGSNIEEVKIPDVNAQLVAEEVARKIMRRIAFRRAMKQALFNSKSRGAQGIKIMCSGRLNGAEIARTEWYINGRIPLHTIRAKIQFGFAEAKTTYGVIGIKVWIYTGDRPR